MVFKQGAGQMQKQLRLIQLDQDKGSQLVESRQQLMSPGI